mgnify:CR=1 FL=1
MKSNEIGKNEVPIFVLSTGIPILLALIFSLVFFSNNLFAIITLTAIASLFGWLIYKRLNRRNIQIKINKFYVMLLWIILAIVIIFTILSTAIWLFR